MPLFHNLLCLLVHPKRLVRHCLAPSATPKLIMTLLVKDEADIIAQNLTFHRAMGVDGFVVTDNGSTDGTRQILEDYQRRGWILRLIDEPELAYRQKQWVDRMVRIAADDFAADWVINADADEFWFSPSGSLKAQIAAQRATLLRCPIRNVLPEAGLPLTQWTQLAQAVPDAQALGLSKYSLFSHTTHKVMHSAAGYLKISMGNHKALMLPHLVGQSDIEVWHFSLRSRAHLRSKVENGGRAISLLGSERVGRHWRYFYDCLQRGVLDAEYDRIVGSDVRETLSREGYITTDARLAAFFAAHPELCVTPPAP